MAEIRTLNKISERGTEILTRAGWEVSGDFQNPEGILVRSASMEDFVFNPALLAVARAGAGTNNIPVARCTQSGIVVFNTPGANAEAVKELAICAIILASRDVLGGVEWVRSIAGRGSEIPALVEKEKGRFVGPEIGGKSLGVVGLGAVGTRVANAALELDMEVWGYDPFLSVDAAWQLSREVHHAMDLDAIFKNCDYITLHVPYLPETYHIIGAGAIAKMRDGARLINLARGELVSDEDVLKGLKSGKIARYVTDFPNGNLAAAPGVIPLPHLGASTPESEEKCAVMAAKQLLDYLENGNIKNSVNLPDVSLDRTGSARLCVIHRNVPRMITSFLERIGERNINVENMINKAQGDFSYTLIDTDAAVSDGIVTAISEMEGVVRVRVL